MVHSFSAMGTPAPTVQWQVNTGSGFADLAGAISSDIDHQQPDSGNEWLSVSGQCSQVLALPARQHPPQLRP